MSCFFSHAGRTAIPALLSVALAAAACNKDGEITLPDSKPRITLDSETGVYAAKIGRAVTITPTVENEGEALTAGRSTTRSFPRRACSNTCSTRKAASM